MSHDGHIEVVTLTRKGRVLARQRLCLPGWDLRDPKLSIDDRGVLWLTSYAKTVDAAGNVLASRNLSWFSKTGTSWSSMHWFGENHWWLWKITWHNKQAFSLAYHRYDEQLDLFTGHPGKQMQRTVSHVLSKRHHNLGYPNESVLHFDRNDHLWALSRRDKDSLTAQLGRSAFPHTGWVWRDLGMYIGGPAWLPLTHQTMLVCGRDIDNKRVATKLWLLHKPSAQLQDLCTLPSAGDTSYPGLVIDQDTLYVSYYSSHIDNVSRVYLATLSGIKALRDIVEQREIRDPGK